MNQLQVSARFPNIAPNQLAEFKVVVAELIAMSRDEPGTLRYDFFMNAEETACVVREVYADSDACLAHLAGVGVLLGRIIPLGGGIEIECYGAPSPALMTAAAALSPKVYGHLAGK